MTNTNGLARFCRERLRILAEQRHGSPWRDLPPDFGLWNSVYKRFARWSRAKI
ncbi:hypothetical protein CE195_12985 [Sodalis-like symbiont of Philaenus spumarius]|nr:hypothetical protein CE195_12985 [Sodalis-like symbiont of Philaenus spumarius]